LPGWFARFMLAALALPTLKSALGVDGGAMFQILAVENLGASPAAIGTALGLGVLSVPVQLWAARLSITVSRRNLLAFFGMIAAAAVLLATLALLAGTETVVAVVGLGVTVVAEIAVSVLFATSWQPLLSSTLTSNQRQNINSRGRAAGSAVLVLVLVLFGSGGTAVRVAILVGVAVVACAMMLVLRNLPVPMPGDETRDDVAVTVHAGADVEAGRSVPRAVVPLLVLVGFAAASAWPLFPVYAAKVYWPSADLGIIGAVQTGASIAVAAFWRPTTGDLLVRARVAAAALVSVCILFVALPATTGSGVVEVVTLIAFGLAVASRDVVLLAQLELVHRGVNPRTSVRTLTILDVVESTSLQAGLFVGGLVITWSATVDLGPTDPYQLYTLGIAVGVATSLWFVPRRQP
jgi:hypothetical protein